MPINFSPPESPSQEILLTRQRHEADRAGLHYDIRMVIGDKAFSWATKKDMPEQGQSILLHEQPVHDRSYALSPRVEIPAGQYGAGVTTLDFVRKAKLVKGKDYYTLHTHTGEKYLLKHLPGYGEGKGWLFKNLGKSEKKMSGNKYLEKIAGSRWKLEALKRGLVPNSEKLGINTHSYHDYNQTIRDSLGYGVPNPFKQMHQQKVSPSHHRGGNHDPSTSELKEMDPRSHKLISKVLDNNDKIVNKNQFNSLRDKHYRRKIYY